MASLKEHRIWCLDLGAMRLGGRGFVAECGAGAEELAKIRQRVKDEEGSPRGELAPAGRLRGECCYYA